MTIIWCMVPELWNTTDIIFLSFWTIFYLFTPLTTCQIKILKKTKKPPGDIIILIECTINDNHMMYGSWDMKSNRQNFLSFWAILLIYTKIVIIYYTFPEIWQMADVKLIFILGYFLHFYPINRLKNQKFLKVKKTTPGDIIILHRCTNNHDHMLYCSWDMVHDGCNYFSF